MRFLTIAVVLSAIVCVIKKVMIHNSINRVVNILIKDGTMAELVRLKQQGKL